MRDRPDAVRPLLCSSRLHARHMLQAVRAPRHQRSLQQLLARANGYTDIATPTGSQLRPVVRIKIYAAVPLCAHDFNTWVRKCADAHHTRSSVGPLQDEDRFGQDPLDGQEYKMALARTRQAVSVHKAMIFQSQGNPARCPPPFLRTHACLHADAAGRHRPVIKRRLQLEALKRCPHGPQTGSGALILGPRMAWCRAMVELRRALQENAIVREPLLNNRYEQQQVSSSIHDSAASRQLNLLISCIV